MKKKKREHRDKSNPFHANSPAKIETISYPARLNKYIAKCGICSRRKAAELVKSGKIKVNGQTVLEPYLLVNAQDQVHYQDQLLSPEEQFIYILINKPINVITTTDDEHQRKTVLDLIADEAKERLFPVGRLDRNTTGLLLLTNDGDLAKKLSHPSHEVRKEYLVTLDRPLDEQDLISIRKGLTLEDGPVPVNAVAHPDERKKQTIEIAIHIGRNRIVRRIFEHLGYKVKALERTYYAGLTLKNLPRGKYRHLSPREVVMLKHFS